MATKLSEKSNFETPEAVPTKQEFQARYVIMGNYIILFNFVCKLQCFQGFMRRKRVLVLNLVEISIEFLIFMFILLKITDHENLFVRSLRAWTRSREHFLYY